AEGGADRDRERDEDPDRPHPLGRGPGHQGQWGGEQRGDRRIGEREKLRRRRHKVINRSAIEECLPPGTVHIEIDEPLIVGVAEPVEHQGRHGHPDDRKHREPRPQGAPACGCRAGRHDVGGYRGARAGEAARVDARGDRVPHAGPRPCAQGRSRRCSRRSRGRRWSRRLDEELGPMTRWRWLPVLVVLLSVVVCGGAWAADVTDTATVRPGAPETTSREQTASDAPFAVRVAVIGVPGLEWGDVDEFTTPNLWRLVGEGGAGSLSTRTVPPPDRS